MGKILFVLFFCSSLVAFSQEATEQGVQTDSKRIVQEQDTSLFTREEGWQISGVNSFLLNQAAFSNWVVGGINSLAGTINIDYEFNYTKKSSIWDTRVMLGYGISKIQEESTQKVQDIININSFYGRRFTNSNWYIGSAFGFMSQFTKTEDPFFENEKISNFMAPGYVILGLGFDYRPSESFTLNIHPVTSKSTFVLDEDLQVPGFYGLEEEGQSFIYEMGAFVGVRYRKEVFKNIIVDNRLGLFLNYLDVDGVDVAYNTMINLSINDYVSTQITLDVLYDKDQSEKVQIRQGLGVGITYIFPTNKDEEFETF